MISLTDYKKRIIRLSKERLDHLEDNHPEMDGQFNKIKETLLSPDCILMSKSDPTVEMFYRHYVSTPVKEKFLCVVVKYKDDDNFIITAYFTDTIKKGLQLWKKK